MAGGRETESLNGGTDMQSVKFKNREVEMAGNLYMPPNFDESRKYGAIVVVHPGGGVKEQAAGLYAKLLAEHGFVTLAFDSSYQGETGGSPHFLDVPMNRVDDVYSAIDYVTTLPYVDDDRIGVAGVCAGEKRPLTLPQSHLIPSMLGAG